MSTNRHRMLLRPNLQSRPEPALWGDVYAQLVRTLAPHAPEIVMDAISDVPQLLTSELYDCRDALFARSRFGGAITPYMALSLDGRDAETLDLVARFAVWSRCLDMSGRGVTELWVRAREPWLRVWVPASSTLDVDVPLPGNHLWIREQA